jgi:L,D-transpeptidase catalytic domain/Putative peptidoglycan binding domain
MKRPALAALLLSVCLVGGCVAAVVATSPGAIGAVFTTIPTTGTEPVATTTTTTTTTTAEQRIAAGVTIGGVRVGGMTAADAYTAVRNAFERPLVLLAGKHRLQVQPEQLGAVAYALEAVNRAQTARSGTAIPLRVSVRRAKVVGFVAHLAHRFDRAPVDSQLSLRRLRPWLSPSRSGASLRRKPAVRLIVAELVANRRTPIRLRIDELVPRVTRANFGPVIVIRRTSNHLYLYHGMTQWRLFVVATGQNTYPTPLGRFQIVVKWRNPWWYPPNSPWAAGQKPIPPGPNNPLGTRWMGLSAPGVGIHGTPNDGSIGYSVSHGCIRMHIPDAEWLFVRVRIGTPVYIVAA